jgi:hypothetical protein
MNNPFITAALARQHRADLLRRADEYRRAAGAAAIPLVSATPTWSDPVVVRRINTSPSEVAQRIVWDGEPPGRLALAGLGELRVEGQGRPDPAEAGDVWQISSRLVGTGPRIARFSRVDIEIRPASSHAVELRLRPRSRHIHRWATRRHRRYFRLAHAAADRLVELFAA